MLGTTLIEEKDIGGDDRSEADHEIIQCGGNG
jgi:hypothetical protein